MHRTERIGSGKLGHIRLHNTSILLKVIFVITNGKSKLKIKSMAYSSLDFGKVVINIKSGQIDFLNQMSFIDQEATQLFAGDWMDLVADLIHFSS